MERHMIKTFCIMLLVFILGCTRNDERISIQDVVNVQKIELTRDEKEWVNNNRIVKWTVEKNRPPYLWHDYSTPYGLSKDYIDIISAKTGLQFEPVFTESLRDSLDLIRANKADVVTSVRTTPSRAEYLRFTPIYSFSNMMLVFNNEKPNVPLKIGITEGAAANEYVKSRFPKLEIIAFNNDAEAVQALKSKMIDGAVMDFYTYTYLSKILDVEFLATPIDFDYTTAFAYRPDAEILGSILTKAIASITLEERAKIIKRWTE